jgi:uncharacterized damage-inducible protein DinB
VTASDDLFVIGPRAGYAPRVGTLASQLENARHYLRGAVRGLGTAALHARPAPARNAVAEILAHLVAAEALMRAITLEDRMLDPEREPEHVAALRFTAPQAPDRDLGAYLRDLASSREATLAGLRARDDAWLDAPKTFFGRPANVHYYWLHYLQDEARHTGQITLIRKYLLPTPEPGIDPYAPDDPPE